MVVKQDYDESFALIARQRRAATFLMGTTVVVVVIVALIVAGSLSQPIRAAARVAQGVAAGDLTEEIRLRSTGEPGLLLASIQKMITYLRSLIGKIQMSSVSLLSTATEIAATSKQQEETMSEFGASTNQAAAAVKQISGRDVTGAFYTPRDVVTFMCREALRGVLARVAGPSDVSRLIDEL